MPFSFAQMDLQLVTTIVIRIKKTQLKLGNNYCKKMMMKLLAKLLKILVYTITYACPLFAYYLFLLEEVLLRS